MVRRLVIAPDGFKGSCTARAAAEALARGARAAAASLGVEIAIDCLPLSDGGDGFLDALGTVVGGEARYAAVRPVDRARPGAEPVRWLWQAQNRTAWGAVSEVVGLDRTRSPSPRGRTARGVGEYVQAMKDAGARRIVLGIGGTATVDGGAGVAAGLGARFERDGQPIDVFGATEAARATAVVLPEPWRGVDVACWCDVTSPLLGPAGAAVAFGPQKGAEPGEVAELERDIAAWAALVRGRRSPDEPGMGAGGGIPFGVALCTGARLERGAPAVLEALEFDRCAAGADQVWTGEGRLDATTRAGKLVDEVLRRAARAGSAATAFAGSVDVSAAGAYPEARLVSLTGPEVTLARSLAEPEMVLEAAAFAQAANWLARERADSPLTRE